MFMRQLFDADTSTYTYLLADMETGRAVLIDPVLDQVERDVALLEELGLTLVHTLETHAHADHITGGGTLRDRLGSTTIVSKYAGAECANRVVDDGDTIEVDGVKLEVRATPGHTPGCVTFVTADHQNAFTGDAMLIRGCGRTDFQGGSAETLYDSIHEKVFTLPDEAKIWPGHDYKGHTHSTVAEEKAHNRRLKTGIDKAAFVEIMDGLGLQPPRHIDVAVPANLRCGIAPQSSEDETKRERGWAPITRTAAGVPEVPAAWVYDNAANFHVVDVREAFEIAEKPGIEGATNAPIGTIEEAAKAWDKERPVVLICRSGNRSGKAAVQLEALGFKRVASMAGGVTADVGRCA